MIFDTLCEISAMWFPELVPILRYATIIKFDVTAHKVLDKQVPPDDVITFRDEFTLPTRIVAIEDKADCTILMDCEPNMRGLFKRRAFVNCVPVDRDITEPYAEIGDIGMMRAFARIAPPGTCLGVFLFSILFMVAFGGAGAIANLGAAGSGAIWGALLSGAIFNVDRKSVV